MKMPHVAQELQAEIAVGTDLPVLLGAGYHETVRGQMTLLELEVARQPLVGFGRVSRVNASGPSEIAVDLLTLNELDRKFEPSLGLAQDAGRGFYSVDLRQ